MSPAQASSLRSELLALVDRLARVDTQLAEGRPHAAAQTVARACGAARQLADELVPAATPAETLMQDRQTAA